MKLKHKVRINIVDRNGHKQEVLQSEHRSIKADKENFTKKINGAITLIMGLDRGIRRGNDTRESIYDSRKLLVF